ncbi:MAG: hypothetical protein J3R72DRAFT_427954 [Linnemannia gamsii]|nr:MAG: hypothetical protein J3R72DRAFT_427954 [Linnemannia gamsii]
MQDSDDDQASRRNAASSNNRVPYSHPRTPRKARRNSGDDTDGELNDGYGEDYSAHHPSHSGRRSNNGLGWQGEFVEDADIYGISPVTPLKALVATARREKAPAKHKGTTAENPVAAVTVPNSSVS